MITENISTLVNYGIAAGLLDEADRIYTINRLLELFGLDDYEEPQNPVVITNAADFDLEGLLKQMLDYAAEKGILPDDSIVYRDLFDTKVMSLLLPRPSEVISKFQKLYEEQGAKAATDWYYTFSQNTDYIRRYRIARDRKWKADTEYGEMDITINLSKSQFSIIFLAKIKNCINITLIFGSVQILQICCIPFIYHCHLLLLTTLSKQKFCILKVSLRGYQGVFSIDRATCQ